MLRDADRDRALSPSRPGITCRSAYYAATVVSVARRGADESCCWCWRCKIAVTRKPTCARLVVMICREWLTRQSRACLCRVRPTRLRLPNSTCWHASNPLSGHGISPGAIAARATVLGNLLYLFELTDRCTVITHRHNGGVRGRLTQVSVDVIHDSLCQRSHRGARLGVSLPLRVATHTGHSICGYG